MRAALPLVPYSALFFPKIFCIPNTRLRKDTLAFHVLAYPVVTLWEINLQTPFF